MYTDIDCPYCDKGQDIDHDDGHGYEEDRFHEQECSECGKVFTFVTSHTFSYEVNKAECLNGGEHIMEPVSHYPRHWPDWVRCKNCDHDVKGDFTKLSYESK